MTRRALLIALALVAIAAPDAAAALRFSGENCPGNFECARLTVPLDRSGRVPGTVRLSIERAQASGARDGAVFALAGGPGQGASSVTEGFNRDTAGDIGARDLIVVDQRGTGKSGALDCAALERPSDAPIDERTARCAEELGPARHLYTTADTVEDLEAVRAALEIPRITLLGVSYGTKVALAYAQRHPEHVERLVLDSVVEADGPDPFDLDSFAAMPRVLDELCRRECAGVTPSLSSDVAALVDRMPIRGPFVDRRGRRRTRTVTARDLYQQIRAGDSFAELRVQYPGAVRAALPGDPAPLVRAIHAGSDAEPFDPEESFAEGLSFTLQAATLCDEAPLPYDRGAPPQERDRQARERAEAIPDARFEPFDRGTALAADSNSLLFQCRRWPAPPPRDVPPPQPFPDVPVLVIEGEEDVRTPVEVGARVAAQFPRGRLVRVAKTGHAALTGTRCAHTALRRFFADQPIDAGICRSARRSARVLPVPPAKLAELAAGGGRPARTLAAVALTLEDLRRASQFGTDRGGGLRAGTFAANDERTVLRGFSFVPGVAVSGRLALTPRGLRGRLRVRGAAAARGTLTLSATGRLTGRLGGRRVRGRVP